MFWKKSKSHVTRVQLWRSVLSYVWDTSLMFGIFVLCIGYLCYVWDINLMSGIFVLCLGYLSYVWDICLMYVLGTKYLVPSTWYQVRGTELIQTNRNEYLDVP